MFRHSPDFQFKNEDHICGFYRIQARCGKLLRLQRDRGESRATTISTEWLREQLVSREIGSIPIS